MSAMPEREVFATESNEQEWLVSYLREAMKMAEKLVPESRLLAAEARVREVEAERDARRERKVALMECEEREATLRAERDAQAAENDHYQRVCTDHVSEIVALCAERDALELDLQKWIGRAIYVESKLRKEIDVLRTQLESHNA